MKDALITQMRLSRAPLLALGRDDLRSFFPEESLWTISRITHYSGVAPEGKGRDRRGGVAVVVVEVVVGRTGWGGRNAPKHS